MRFALWVALATLTGLAAAFPHQTILGDDGSIPGTPGYEPGVGHFSEWSRQTKKAFLLDWQAGRMSDWILVTTNEGGDTDSMTSALSWAYHLAHSTPNISNRTRAIALLQTRTDALDLRPENKLALANSQMSTGHSDLLTIDELPEDPETLSHKIHGIILVDHAKPLHRWKDAEILSIFDHHEDQGIAKDAKPRVIEKVASCTTLVARQMLDELEELPKEYHMPHELLELILSAIAIDSKGLKSDKATDTDIEVSKRILARSNWRKKDLYKVMKKLKKDLKKAEKDIDNLDLRDLIRRDYKADLIDTPSPRTPTIFCGFASIPYSMEQQINKTEFQALFDWFAVEAAWTAEARVDIDVTLTKYKVHDKHGKKRKIREIVLVVRDNVRIDEKQADSLFQTVSLALETDKGLNLRKWHRADELSPRQMVWVQGEESDAGRKVVRPLVEKALMEWDMPKEE